VAPNSVLQTALIPISSPNLNVVFYDTASNYENFQYYYVKVYTVELQKLSTNQSRQFNISLNSDLIYTWPYDFVTPGYLEARYWSAVAYSSSIIRSLYNVFSLLQLSNSTLPPILNGIEFYWAISMETDQLTSADDGKIKVLSFGCRNICSFIFFGEK
jgi:Malectin-like domain